MQSGCLQLLGGGIRQIIRARRLPPACSADAPHVVALRLQAMMGRPKELAQTLQQLEDSQAREGAAVQGAANSGGAAGAAGGDEAAG